MILKTLQRCTQQSVGLRSHSRDVSAFWGDAGLLVSHLGEKLFNLSHWIHKLLKIIRFTSLPSNISSKRPLNTISLKTSILTDTHSVYIHKNSKNIMLKNHLSSYPELYYLLTSSIILYHQFFFLLLFYFVIHHRFQSPINL